MKCKEKVWGQNPNEQQHLQIRERAREGGRANEENQESGIAS